MGIKQLYSQIGRGQRISLAKLAAEKLQEAGRPLRVAIDISIWQFQIQSGRGGTNPALRTLYYRLIRLLGLGVNPIFVFDGKNKPPFKRGKRTIPGAASLPDYLSKQLLSRFGFPYHIAPGEAEAECALMQREGIVDVVLSEDVDTLMFGCSMFIRNWSAEGSRSNKTPTHVDLYNSKEVKEEYGLDSRGMILIALMSGGDYIPAGIPGCGIKTAVEAAKAGFGNKLCKIGIKDEVGFQTWRETLEEEMHTNKSGYFRTRKNQKIPEDFPDRKVLGYYMYPVVSSMEQLETARKKFVWDKDVDIAALREFVADAFEWKYKTGAAHFIRCLAPAMVVHRLLTRWKCQQDEEDDIIKSIHSKRTAAVTDGLPELRVSFIPSDIVGWDLESEEDDPTFGQSDDDSEVSDLDEAPKGSTKKTIYDPTKLEKAWVLQTILELGIPATVEEWTETMKNKKPASRKARTKKEPETSKHSSIVSKPRRKRTVAKEAQELHLQTINSIFQVKKAHKSPIAKVSKRSHLPSIFDTDSSDALSIDGSIVLSDTPATKPRIRKVVSKPTSSERKTKTPNATMDSWILTSTKRVGAPPSDVSPQTPLRQQRHSGTQISEPSTPQSSPFPNPFDLSPELPAILPEKHDNDVDNSFHSAYSQQQYSKGTQTPVCMRPKNKTPRSKPRNHESNSTSLFPSSPISLNELMARIDIGNEEVRLEEKMAPQETCFASSPPDAGVAMLDNEFISSYSQPHDKVVSPSPFRRRQKNIRTVMICDGTFYEAKSSTHLTCLSPNTSKGRQKKDKKRRTKVLVDVEVLDMTSDK